VLRGVAGCCSVFPRLQKCEVITTILYRVAKTHRMIIHTYLHIYVYEFVYVYEYEYVYVYLTRIRLQRRKARPPHSASCCSVLQCVAVCCSVLQCAAVCCSVL